VRRKNKPVGPVAAKLWQLMQDFDTKLIGSRNF
jgi:hypothetical protein